MAFPATHWSVIDAARAGDSEAVTRFIERYRQPIVRYLQGRGLGSDAEDLAQEVFLRLFDGRLLKGADPTRGRFRSLVLAITRNVLGHHLEHQHAQKRGAGKVVPLGEAINQVPDGGDDAFDREWLLRLLQIGLSRLKEQHPTYHRAIDLYLVGGRSQGEVAKIMECPKQNVGNFVLRGRRKLVEYAHAEIRSYVTSSEEFNEELRALARCFPALAKAPEPPGSDSPPGS